MIVSIYVSLFSKRKNSTEGEKIYILFTNIGAYRYTTAIAMHKFCLKIWPLPSAKLHRKRKKT